MNYVARAVLPREVAAKRQFYGVYEWHKAAWELFSGKPDARSEDLGFLFRVDEDETELRLTVASKNKPLRPAWCSEESWRCRLLPPEYLEQKNFVSSSVLTPLRRHEKILIRPRVKRNMAGTKLF